MDYTLAISPDLEIGAEEFAAVWNQDITSRDIAQATSAGAWSEPLRVDNELSNFNSWREIYEKDEAALRPCIQDIGNSRT